MVLGVSGIGSVDETGAVKPTDNTASRRKAGSVTADRWDDAVVISPVGRIAAQVGGEDSVAVRLDRIAEARRRIAEGRFKSPDIVEELAFRLNVYLG